MTKEGTVPVPSLFPPLRFAIMCYYLFWVHRNRGRHSGGGKPKVKPPGTLWVGVELVVY
jgi:hypothetical protein